jgi:hypothetical protein
MTKIENNKQKPTLADYQKRSEYSQILSEENKLNTDLRDEYLNFVNAIDWSSEIFTEGDLCGLKNALGDIILKPKYEDIKVFLQFETTKGNWVAAKQNEKWGIAVVDGEGSWLIEPQFDYIGLPNKFMPVYKDEKWGVLNLETKDYLIPIECDSISIDYGFMFINGLAVYTKNNKHGVINYHGEFTDAIFDDIDWFEGSVKVSLNGEWGFINANNQFTLDEDEAHYSANDGF